MATLQENLHCWFNFDATKPNVIENRICEGADCLNAALSSGVTSLQFTVASAKSVSGGSNEAVTLLNLVPWAGTVTCRMNAQNSRLTPLTRIFIDTVDSSLLPLLFLRSLSILSDCPALFRLCTTRHSCRNVIAVSYECLLQWQQNRSNAAMWLLYKIPNFRGCPRRCYKIDGCMLHVATSQPLQITPTLQQAHL